MQSSLAFAAFLVGAAGAPYLVAGWGLLERRPWAPVVAIVAGMFALIYLPFGIALSIYTLWLILSNPPLKHAWSSRALEISA